MRSNLVEYHSSGDGYAWRTVYVVNLPLAELRVRRDQFLQLPVTDRPLAERDASLPGNKQFAAFFVWLRSQGISVELGPRGVYGLDNPTAEQQEAATAARAVVADVEFAYASEPETPLSVI